jgi:hypothetical protein
VASRIFASLEFVEIDIVSFSVVSVIFFYLLANPAPFQ